MGDPFTVNVQDLGPGADQPETTTLNIGGGYVGEPTPMPGYNILSTVNAPNVTPPAGSLSAWLQANKSAVYLGAGALFLMAMFGGRRR